MSFVYCVLDYPWDAGYILSVEFVGVACGHVHVSFLFERGYLLVDLLGAVSGMRKELLLRPYFALFAFAVVEAVRSQHRQLGQDQGSGAGNSFSVVMFVMSRGAVCTPVWH